MGSEALDDLPWSLELFVRVGAREIEIELIGLGLGEEFAATGEGFQIEELIFDQAKNGFDIALGARRKPGAESATSRASTPPAFGPAPGETRPSAS